MSKSIAAVICGFCLLGAVPGAPIPFAQAELIPAGCASTPGQWSVDFELFRPDGATPLGRHHAEGTTSEGKQWLKSVTSFIDGSRWEEEAVVGLGEAVRPLIYQRRYRSPGGKWERVKIDYKQHIKEEEREGKKERAGVELPDDTYVGPMVGLVVRCAAQGKPVEFHSLSFQNHPGIHSMTAKLVGEGHLPWGPKKGRVAVKVRLKADLGTIGNFLLGSVIPDNTFWLSPAETRGVLAWDGPSDWAARSIVAVRIDADKAGGDKEGAR